MQVGCTYPMSRVVSGPMSGWWILDSFVLKILSPRLITHSSACSLLAQLHHCLSLTNWDVVKNFHSWVFHPNSSWHKSQSTVGFERQWCRWVVHTQWVASEWADVLNTKESKTHHPLINPLTTCELGMYNPPVSLSLKSNSTLTFMPTAIGVKHL